MKDAKLQQLKTLIETSYNSLSKDDFVQSFQTVVFYVKEAEKRLISSVENAISTLKDQFSVLKNDLFDKFSAFEQGVSLRINAALEEQNKGMRLITDKVRRIKEGKDGQDGRDGAPGTPGVNGRDGKDGSPDTPQEIKTKLETLSGDKRLNKDAISGLDDLEKRLKAVESRPTGRGGGTSAIGVAQTFKYIAHTEAPSGDIDGVNVTYTVKNTIFWVAGFTLNGEQIAELPNFTYAGKTITFASALPADYSGKDWEIKYIGT